MTSRTLTRLQTRLKQREAVGVLKYNQTIDRRDLRPVDWLGHLQEELMDAALYAERLRDALPLLHEARALLKTGYWYSDAGTMRRLQEWRETYDELFSDENREQ